MDTTKKLRDYDSIHSYSHPLTYLFEEIQNCFSSKIFFDIIGNPSINPGIIRPHQMDLFITIIKANNLLYYIDNTFGKLQITFFQK